MKKTNLIFVIIGALVLLGLGYSYGYFLGQKEFEETKIEEPLANLLESKVIGGIDTVASGEITEIAGHNLTLIKEGDTLTILIGEGVAINRIVPPEEITIPPQPVKVEEIEFGEIKVGDQVDISCLLKADGSLDGRVVTIFPTL